jgi:hypothetical protein
MAQGVGSAKAVSGAQDTFGGKFYGIADYSGPASYVSGGDAVDPHIFGFPNAILTLIGSEDQSNTYIAVPRPMASGFQVAWQLVWRTASTGAEVAPGTNLSTFTVRLSALGI